MDPTEDDTRYVAELPRATSLFSSLEALGIDRTDVCDVLETVGVDEFIA